MKSFRDRNPYAVGLVSILVIGLLTGFAFMVGLLHLLEDAYEVRASFTDAAGLRTGDEVKLAGVEVGRVTEIDTDQEHGLVEVSFVVNSGVEVGSDATADISLETLLGAKFIRLGETTSGEPMESLPKERRHIPVERTTTPVDVFALTRDATERIEETDNDKLNTLIGQLATVTEGKREQITQLLEGIDRVSTALTERDAELEALLDEVDVLAANLAAKDQQLIDLIDAGDRILDFLVERRDVFATALGEGSEAIRGLAELIATNKAALDAILDDLHPTLEVVESNLADLNAGLAISGPAFYGQSLAGSHGPFLDIFVAALGPDVLGILESVIGDALDAEAAP